MLISTQTDVLGRVFGDIEAVNILADIGYDAIDYSMFGMRHPEHPLNGDGWYGMIKPIRDAADSHGIKFNQSHAPFSFPLTEGYGFSDFMLSALRRAIEITAALGAGTVIIHPITLQGESPERQKTVNMELFSSFKDLCSKYGVRVALENMWVRDPATHANIHAACSSAEQFNDYLDTLGSENYTGCLDLGHCGLVGENTADMLRAMGSSRITALHVHDNDNLNDLHTLPFLQKLDWPGICAALHDIGYTGELTFEADNFIGKFPKSLIPEASAFMYKTGRKLVEMIENS